MKKKTFLQIIVMFVITVAFASNVLASVPTPPQGQCPPGQHQIGSHEDGSPICVPNFPLTPPVAVKPTPAPGGSTIPWRIFGLCLDVYKVCKDIHDIFDDLDE